MSYENLRPAVLSRVLKEVQDLIKSPIEGVTVAMPEHDVTVIAAEIIGPAGTPYEGGIFRVTLTFGPEFPTAPPKGLLLTKIFHPNISKSGEICVNTLKRDWSPNHTIRHVLQVVRCLLIEPYPESALNEEAAKMLLEDYEGYAKHARLMTSIHALPRQQQQQQHLTPADQPQAEKKDTKAKKNLRRL
eukprot:c4764_g1_i1.p1 GENE.c4764_g1_i1~~c4764_g1_i1.p1  ORF type:complete len:188 (+),score=39.80 c4764_g1_i1:105-668(+)